MTTPQHDPSHPAQQPKLQPLPNGSTPGPRPGRHAASAAGGSGALSSVLATPTGRIGAAAAALMIAAIAVGLLRKQSGPEEQSPSSVPLAQSQIIRPVAVQETEKAIAQLMMSEPEKTKVRSDLGTGKLRIGWITVSDSQAEDGDWVRLSAGGFHQDVRLLHKPFTMAVPYLPGMPVTVTGLADGGGGGITISVYIGSAGLPLKPMQKGESVQIPMQ